MTWGDDSRDWPVSNPYSGEWVCDQQGGWKRCYAPGCTYNRRPLESGEWESDTPDRIE